MLLQVYFRDKKKRNLSETLLRGKMSPNFVELKMTDYQKTEWISLCLVLQEIT